MKAIIRLLGLKGSWKWACRQLEKGHVIYRATDTGYCKYKLDNEDQRRIQWCFLDFFECGKSQAGWEDAKIFLSDFECTCWEIW
jgi:hypothetical protein